MKYYRKKLYIFGAINERAKVKEKNKWSTEFGDWFNIEASG